MPITPLPTPPSRQDPGNFASRADDFLGALPTFATEANATATQVNSDATGASNSAAAAAASAAGATAVSGVTKWVSGTTYAEGAAVWSPATFLTYRRKAAGAGTTDPSADTTNWAPIAGTGNVSTSSGVTTLQGTATVGATVKLLEGSNNGAHAVNLRAPASIAADLTLTLPGSAGAAGQALVSDGAGGLSFGAVGASLQEFASSGTWTKPAGATFVLAEEWAGGGGGGSGRSGNAGIGTYGGGGGGGGAYGFRLFRAADLPASVSVTIGAGGAGGASRAANAGSGQTGTTGGNTTFGGFLTVFGGAGGVGGTTASVGGGQGGGVLSNSAPSSGSNSAGHFGPGSSNGSSSGYGGATGGASANDGGSSFQGGPAGAGGGSYDTLTSSAGNGGGIVGSSGTGAAGGLYPGTNGVAGSGRQGGGGGAAGYATNAFGRNVAFGNGTFAAVDTTGFIYTSANGTSNWTFVQTPSGLGVPYIAHDGTQFVLLNSNATRCWTTTNFSTFTERAAPSSGVSPQTVGLRYVNGNYFIPHGTGLLRSTDLATWSSVSTGLSAVRDICWSGTHYVAVSDSTPFVRRSSDLTTWSTATGIGTSAAFSCTSNGSGTVVVVQSGTGGLNAVRSTDNGATFANVATTLPSASATLSFVNSTYFYVGFSEIWSSTDGTNWSQRSTGVFDPRGAVAFDGTTFAVSNGNNSTTPVYTSVPAALGTWTARNLNARSVAAGAGGAGGTFGAGGGGGGGSDSGFASGAGGNGGDGYARIYSW